MPGYNGFKANRMCQLEVLNQYLFYAVIRATNTFAFYTESVPPASDPEQDCVAPCTPE